MHFGIFVLFSGFQNKWLQPLLQNRPVNQKQVDKSLKAMEDTLANFENFWLDGGKKNYIGVKEQIQMIYFVIQYRKAMSYQYVLTSYYNSQPVLFVIISSIKTWLYTLITLAQVRIYASQLNLSLKLYVLTHLSSFLLLNDVIKLRPS